MARKLKPHKLLSFVHQASGEELEVLLDRNTDPMQFYCMVLGERVTGVDEKDCKAKAYVRCSELSQYKWEKILVVYVPPMDRTTHCNFGSSTFHRHELYLNYTVHEVSKSGEGKKWREKKHAGDVPGGHITTYHGATESCPGRGEYVISWSEELERGLERIREHIREVHEHLHRLLGHDDVVKMLTKIANGGRLLEEGKRDE